MRWPPAIQAAVVCHCYHVQPWGLPHRQTVAPAPAGNSLAMRIPKALADQAAMREGSEIKIFIADGRLVAMPVRSNPDLQMLLAGVTEANLHGEIDAGPPVGRESL